MSRRRGPPPNLSISTLALPPSASFQSAPPILPSQFPPSHSTTSVFNGQGRGAGLLRPQLLALKSAHPSRTPLEDPFRPQPVTLPTATSPPPPPISSQSQATTIATTSQPPQTTTPTTTTTTKTSLSTTGTEQIVQVEPRGIRGQDAYINGPIPILPQGLYLGSSANAQCLDSLKDYNVKCVINVAEEEDWTHLFHLSQLPIVPDSEMFESTRFPSGINLEQEQNHEEQRTRSRAPSTTSTASSFHSSPPSSPPSQPHHHPHQEDQDDVQDEQQQNWRPSQITHIHLPWTHSHPSISTCFPPVFSLIDSFLSAEDTPSRGAVLIACQQGVSRSASLVLAYLMRTLRQSEEQEEDAVTGRRFMRFEECYEYLKKKSPCVSPNGELVGQLVEFEYMMAEYFRSKEKETGEFRM
ncbi:hypothetical protein HDV05_006638 [Chytridiales sp. JEL 0842]|nr:hypothetical protein HDV05_006638 [Chytridiales sp. JEL 0842]